MRKKLSHKFSRRRITFSGIPTAAVNAFLDRKRKDWRPFKKLSLEALEARMRDLPIRPPIWKKLLIDQKRCFLIGAMIGRFGFHLSTGMGKTLLSLSLARYFMKLSDEGIGEEYKRTLVLVPNRSNKTEWRLEVEKHTSVDCLILDGSTEDKWSQLAENDAPIVVETYGGLMHMCSKLVASDKKKDKKAGKQRLKPSPALVKKLRRMFDGFILDESTLVASKGALTFRVIKALAKEKPMLLELTGTPFGRDPEALWSQIQLLDDGYTLGETLGLYRAAFYTTTEGTWTMFNYTFNNSKAKLLHDCLAHCTINITANEADLPAVVADIKRVKLPETTQKYYNISLQAFQSAHKAADGKGQQNEFVRMRQISSGFLGFKDEVGKGTTIFPDNPKLELLVSLIERIPKEDKIIVYHDFNVSGAIIEQRFKKEKIRFVRLWGGTKDHDAVREAFEHDPACQCLLMSSAGAFGLNLQIAKYGIVYESPVPVIVRKQWQARFIRQHSKDKTKFLIDLVTDDTQDDRILEFHKEGKDLYDAIVRGSFKA